MKHLITLLLLTFSISVAVAGKHLEKSVSETEEAKQAISEEQCE